MDNNKIKLVRVITNIPYNENFKYGYVELGQALSQSLLPLASRKIILATYGVCLSLELEFHSFPVFKKKFLLLLRILGCTFFCHPNREDCPCPFMVM